MLLYRPCLFWGNQQPAELPTPTGEGVPPSLMVQAENDPVTILEGAQTANKAFQGSTLLTVSQAGDHTLYGRGNHCVDHAVEQYLLHGEMTKQNTCEGIPVPAPHTDNH